MFNKITNLISVSIEKIEWVKDTLEKNKYRPAKLMSEFSMYQFYTFVKQNLLCYNTGKGGNFMANFIEGFLFF